ncbi:MAG: protein translocase subunit SecD, partial [Deltaproteobacteria bacterium]|nr:protein translocase subunit SecD [Deltaproteobacteria bacterium]
MSKNLRWRGLIIAIFIVIALLYLIPSLPGGLPNWWPGAFPEEKVHLGLDLQGGMHLILEVEVLKAVENELERSKEDIKENLREEKIRYQDLKRDGIKGINITIIREDQKDSFEDLVNSRFREFELNAGEKVEKGIRYTLLLTRNARDEIIELTNDQALDTIANRIDQFGVSEPDIRPLEGNRIQLQLPGVKDPERAKELIGQVAELEFKLVDSKNSLDEALKGNIPVGDEILYEVSRDNQTGKTVKDPLLVKKTAVLTGKYISDARVSFDQQYNEPYVSLTFNSQGARIFERVTGENVNERLAIVLDNVVHSAPVIRSKISGGRASIEGRFSMEEAKDLAIALRAGSLPAKVNFLEERTVGPSLGKDSINKGFYSMIVGTLIVIVFMVIYYGLSGIIADIALLL